MAFSRGQIRTAVRYVLAAYGLRVGVPLSYAQFKAAGITIGPVGSVPTEAEKHALVDLLKPIILRAKTECGRKHMRSDARHVIADSRVRDR